MNKTKEQQTDMVGYENMGTSNYVLGIWAFLASITTVLLYKLWDWIDSYSADNIYYVSPSNQGPVLPKIPKPPKKIGKTMQCRRYKIVKGKLTVYYTEENTGAIEYQGYYAGAQTAALDASAPPGTTYIYLNCKKAWGYSEKMPDPECCMFGSKKMLDIAEAKETEHALDVLEAEYIEEVKKAGI